MYPMINSDPKLYRSGYERVAEDRYYTEPWVTEALLNRVRFDWKIWEPACGRGDMAKVLQNFGYDVVTSDIAGATLGCDDALTADFLADGGHDDFEDLLAAKPTGLFSIVTNPPYKSKSAERFIIRALEFTSTYQGMVAMLLPNDYDSASTRRHLFGKSFMKKLVLTKRPRWFDQYSAGPRRNFSWFIWDHQYSGEPMYGWLP
jgi:hypothetical protein